MTHNKEKLKELFMQFPGIGPRQAERFVHSLLVRGAPFRNELTTLIGELGESASQCKTCKRFFEIGNNKTDECKICADDAREPSQLMVVVKDVDIEQIEKSGIYKGKYFALGGLIPLTTSKKSFVREKELTELVKALDGTLKEVVFAMPATPDGEYTTEQLQKKLADATGKHGIKVTVLGRGLSTGSEIEYADSDTIKNALKNRA